MIPNDLTKQIAEYISDIDIRRIFNVYKKIDTKKYEILNTITRKECESNVYFKRYYSHKNIFFINNNDNKILNDFIDFVCIDYKNNVIHIKIHIWKLKKRPTASFIHRNDSIYYIDDYEDNYYWKDTIIQYSIK